ncbi:MAG: DcaP family trimeric outer membrane transporter [Bacteroidetes bacterium]|nr:DcaP family trimeric outer membrane transporter [Bacteroidota bacterium]
MKTKRFTFLLMVLCWISTASGQEADSSKWFEVYGFAQTDMGYNFNQVNPQWYDVMRPSKLPSYKNEFGTDGNFYFSVRQSRFGVKTSMPTKWGEFKTVFDFDMFGVGANAGQTTIRLRHAYGQLGHFGAGQTESAFMDLDVFPNTLEYWGPCGMLFFRNVQVRYMPIMKEHHFLVFALEMPGASGDQGVYSDRVELTGVKSHYPFPDITGHYRYTGKKWGYIQLGGVARYIGWKDQGDQAHLDTMNLSGSAIGWGVSLSSGLNIGKVIVLHLQAIYGQGVENYFNDAPVDIGIKKNPGDKTKPIEGVALPDLGLVAFVDLNWSKKFTSSVGWSNTTITNSDGQNPEAYHLGHFVEANLLYYPWQNVMVGVEFQWIYRQNYMAALGESSAYTSQATKINLSFKYSFSKIFYAKKK